MKKQSQSQQKSRSKQKSAQQPKSRKDKEPVVLQQNSNLLSQTSKVKVDMVKLILEQSQRISKLEKKI